MVIPVESQVGLGRVSLQLVAKTATLSALAAFDPVRTCDFIPSLTLL
jgi:hypothetical protein